MKRHRVATVIWLLVLLAIPWASGYSQSPDPDPTSVKAQAEQTEVAVLRAQLEVMRQFDQRLVATVYWALGVTFTVVVLLVGFGWFANFRFYERDKHSLREELSADLKQQIADFRQETNRRLDSDLSRLQKELSDRPEEAIATLRKETRETLKGIRRELMQHTYLLFKYEAKFWENEGVHINALRKQPEMMRIAISIDSDVLVSETLDNIHRLIKKGASARLHPTDISELTELIDKLPPKFTVGAEAVRGLLRAARG